MSRRSRFLPIVNQAILQVGMVALLVWAVLSLPSCARRETRPAGQPSDLKIAGLQDGDAQLVAEILNAPDSNLDRVQFLKLILRDPKLLAMRRQFQQSANATCAPFSSGQIQWFCTDGKGTSQPNDCRFVLETICVAHSSLASATSKGTRTLWQLQVSGQGRFSTKEYQLSTSPRVSKPVTTQFIQEKSR